MLNTSITQLRQIALANLDLPRSPRKRRASSSSTTYHSWKSTDHSTLSEVDEIDENASRPAVLRRRSTRGNPLAEAPVSRFQRLELAIAEHSFESFFTLGDATEPLYVSEILAGKSPCFLPFLVDSRARSMSIVVYAKSEKHPWRRVIRSTIDLTQLQPLGRDATTSGKNEILLQFEDTLWYTTQITATQGPKKPTVTRADSYSLGQLLRLQSSTEFINDALHSIRRLKDGLGETLRDEKSRSTCIREVDTLTVRLDDLKRMLSGLKKRNASDRSTILKTRQSIALRRALMDSSRSQLTSMRSDLCEAQSTLRAKEPALRLMASESQRLQGRIVSHLSDVYPITNTAATGSRIRNLKTARNSEYWQQSEEEAAALGYIAHLVFLLSLYLAIPLRYPIRPLSSHSYILDPVSCLPRRGEAAAVESQALGAAPPPPPPSSGKEGDRRYPLFLERGGGGVSGRGGAGTAGARLSWAVFLLNKDIEQLLQARGLVCGDLRHSLRNLEALVLWLASTPDTPAIDDRAAVSTLEATVVSAGENEAEGSRLEITNHEDLIAAQLRSKIQKGKFRRMERLTEKDETKAEAAQDNPPSSESEIE